MNEVLIVNWGAMLNSLTSMAVMGLVIYAFWAHFTETIKFWGDALTKLRIEILALILILILAFIPRIIFFFITGLGYENNDLRSLAGNAVTVGFAAFGLLIFLIVKYKK